MTWIAGRQGGAHHVAVGRSSAGEGMQLFFVTVHVYVYFMKMIEAEAADSRGVARCQAAAPGCAGQGMGPYTVLQIAPAIKMRPKPLTDRVAGTLRSRWTSSATCYGRCSEDA
jgi:hypothetical protein